MTVINLDNFKKPERTQLKFGGVTYNLADNATLSKLVQIARGEQASVLSGFSKQIGLIDKADKITTMAKYVEFADKHSEEMISATEEIEKRAPAIYSKFFDGALLDANDNPCGAGQKIVEFLDDTTLLTNLFNQIAEMVDNVAEDANETLAQLTKSAYEKASEDD